MMMKILEHFKNNKVTLEKFLFVERGSNLNLEEIKFYLIVNIYYSHFSIMNLLFINNIYL